MKDFKDKAREITDGLFHLPLGTDQDQAGEWLERKIVAALEAEQKAGREQANQDWIVKYTKDQRLLNMLTNNG